ncbi:aspartyl-phosphate phosphatase Spo0E family protein [Paenibacillus sp. DR312]|uniref:aspartyl-phosphate phosphatase Spo0E family protein n=1 Tax=unclassified Paenibacillus TaxID=185978 RepID=UPI001C97558C|nr:aspartyl-phosphate phosphatase Spo0E family protein [Paenibacillus sp. DR312]QZN76563.1 aspartyl-phosphate phosphatase Spo0E family protein [Paenibacillus sp. DR312]
MKYVVNNQESDLERERESLHALVAIYGLQHPIVIKQSEILDELINRYNRMFSGISKLTNT